jgi:histidyl-tRNA synthetase
MALHFDLTVPLARYVAQHFSRLAFPFRRYQIQKVWRGERPQAGRFREFYQCDIDVIGNGSLGLLADAELPCVIHAIFSQLDIGRFVIRINNRKVLQGLLDSQGVAPERVPAALRSIDALEKAGREKVVEELEREAGLPPGPAAELIEVLTQPPDLPALAEVDRGPLYAEGLADLKQVIDGMGAFGLPDHVWQLDLSIARGLDYYTGTVYETRLVDHPQIGSICSGGRYDDLAGTFTKQRLPGVGISIGLTRLLARLFDAGLMAPGPSTPASVLVTVMDRSYMTEYLAIAAELRRAGLNVELYTEPKKIGDQLKYADRKGFRHAVIAGEAEIAEGRVQVKTLASGEQQTLARGDLVRALSSAYGDPSPVPPKG